MALLFNDHQRLAVFNRLCIFDQYGFNDSRNIGLDLVEDFHGLDNANRFTLGNAVTNADERSGTG